MFSWILHPMVGENRRGGAPPPPETWGHDERNCRGRPCACPTNPGEDAMANSIQQGRRSIRMKGFDYSSCGAYFVTICAQDRLHLFGKILDSQMILSAAGKMVENIWNYLPTICPFI